MEESGTDWGFEGAADARAYLGEVGRLWGAWLAGLVALLVVDTVAVVVAGVAVIGLLMWLARPLQARAAAVVPTDTLFGPSRWSIVGKGTARDRVLRSFAYGEEPLRHAVDLSGGSRLWLVGRRVVVMATVAAFAFVLLTWVAVPVQP